MSTSSQQNSETKSPKRSRKSTGDAVITRSHSVGAIGKHPAAVKGIVISDLIEDKRKRKMSGEKKEEPTVCVECKTDMEERPVGLICTECGYWCCWTCTKIPAEVINILSGEAIAKMSFKCTPCGNQKSVLSKIETHIANIQESQQKTSGKLISIMVCE